jgi:hypothetical protein
MHSVNPQVLAVMSEIRKAVTERTVRRWGAEAMGLVEAESTSPSTIPTPSNPGTAADAVDAYLNEIIDRLIYEYEMDEEDALDFVFSCASEVSSLPPLPDDEGETVNTEWLGRATTIGFSGYCLGRARSE